MGSWWQDQAAVWGSMWGTRDIPLLAVIVVLDGLTGLSNFLARRLNIVKWHDLGLLLFVGVWFIYFSFWLDFFPVHPLPIFVDLAVGADENSAWMQAWHRRVGWEVFYGRFFRELEVVCAFGCAVMGRLQGRSYFHWMLLGFMGSFGSVIWLLLNRKQAKGPKAEMDAVRAAG